MNYKKLISCFLIAVLLLQVVSVGGVAMLYTHHVGTTYESEVQIRILK